MLLPQQNCGSKHFFLFFSPLWCQNYRPCPWFPTPRYTAYKIAASSRGLLFTQPQTEHILHRASAPASKGDRGSCNRRDAEEFLRARTTEETRAGRRLYNGRVHHKLRSNFGQRVAGPGSSREGSRGHMVHSCLAALPAAPPAGSCRRLPLLPAGSPCRAVPCPCRRMGRARCPASPRLSPSAASPQPVRAASPLCRLGWLTGICR